MKKIRVVDEVITNFHFADDTTFCTGTKEKVIKFLSRITTEESKAGIIR